eukprot:s2720_g5.t1
MSSVLQRSIDFFFIDLPCKNLTRTARESCHHMSGLYTIFDCLTEGRPFAARVLHEVVHHWAQSAHELASFGAGRDLERFGLCFLRRGGLEQSIPFGKHARTAVHSDLDNLQVSWIQDCDLSKEGQKACDNALDLALEVVGAKDSSEGLAVQVWTFRANQILSSLKTSAWTEKLIAAGIDITVMKLAEPRSELLQVQGVKVVSVASTKSAVRRFLRQRLAVQISIDLELPMRMEPAVEWKMESFQMDSNPSRAVSCSCVPVVLLVPGQYEAATARLSVSAFQFKRFVKLQGIDLCCFYGLPLVARPDPRATALAARLGGREDGVNLQKFLAHLSEGVGALYVSKVCPMELSSKSRSTFTWLATVPLGATEPVVVLRGLCDLHRGAILPEVPPEATSAADPMQGSEKRLEKTWPKLGFYNPWPMAQGGVRVEDAWIPATVEAKAKSVGRPRGSTNREAAELRHKPAKTAATASAPAPASSVAGAAAPSTKQPGKTKGPSKPSEGSLAQLAPMLKQPPRRRLRPAGSSECITEEEVRRLAEGNFQFNF